MCSLSLKEKLGDICCLKMVFSALFLRWCQDLASSMRFSKYAVVQNLLNKDFKITFNFFVSYTELKSLQLNLSY